MTPEDFAKALPAYVRQEDMRNKYMLAHRYLYNL